MEHFTGVMSCKVQVVKIVAFNNNSNNKTIYTFLSYCRIVTSEEVYV